MRTYLIHCAIGLLLFQTNVFSKISLRDEIGQMLIIGFDGASINSDSSIVKSIELDNLGGVVLFDYNHHTNTYVQNIQNHAQTKQLTQDLQFYTKKFNKSHHRPQLPLLIAVDYEGGKVNRLKENYGFPKIPSAAFIGKSNIEYAKKTAHVMASTLHDSGINMDFAPVLDVNINPDNPIIGKVERSFSNNPYKVAEYGSIYSSEFLKQGIQCVYKHFPGHGSSDADSHKGFVDVTNTWSNIELIPYKKLIGQPNACKIVMSAHVVNRKLDSSGLPATLSYKILTEILRKKLKFNGVIVSDDLQMNAIKNIYGLKQAITLTINAGADLLIFGNQLVNKPQDPHEIVDIIVAQVKSGKISRQRIHNSYQRIVALKSGMM